MAFSIRKREEKTAHKDMGLLDVLLMQNLQDRFCEANNLYLVCLSKKHGVITKAHGSREELTYVHSLVGMDTHVSLMNKMMENGIESVVEENCESNLVKMCGVSIRVGGETVAIWIVIGIMENVSDEVPSYIMQTTPDRYYKSIEFLETLSKQMFAVKMEELLAQEAFMRSRESEAQMEAELRRNEVMTGIVKMLESENEFTKIVEDALKSVCNYLHISNGVLLQEDTKQEQVEVLCEYMSADAIENVEPMEMQQSKNLPFFNGKPYMISSNSMMPEEFQRLFEREKINAGIFLPIEVNSRASMYFCLIEKVAERVWDVNDIKFINDVKRIIQTILVKRVAKNSLASSYASLEAILENVGCGIYVKDPVSQYILYANTRFREDFKRTLENHSFERYFPDESIETDYFQEIFLEEEGRWFDFHQTKINWVDGRTVLLGTIYDVSDRKLYQQKIESQANNDMLTGLYNRMRCEQDLERHISNVKEFGGEGALMFIDLDDFKHINDGLGHQYGDILLKSISDSFRRIPGIENSCYRVGGDEFMIIITKHNYMLMNEIIDEIKRLFSRPWMLKETDYYCTMSMGISRFPQDGDNVEELIKKADIALYEAKISGKNRIAFYDGSEASLSFKRLDLEKNMRNAVRNGCFEFEVYFQPIVDITNGQLKCSGAEALIRWNSPTLGFISPADFIPLAEYLGLINQIGEYVLLEACAHCKYWNDMGYPDYTVNVNLSVTQLLQNDIVEVIERAIQETGIMSHNLKLEVTESLAVHDMNRMKRILGEIKKLGCKVALDDFGTGYSSLNYIREMPLDVIKIDRCFIIDIGKDDFSNAFVKMVAELASAIGVDVCVEGVETEEQLNFLRDSRVQYIQGYFFDKPLPAKEFESKYM